MPRAVLPSSTWLARGVRSGAPARAPGGPRHRPSCDGQWRRASSRAEAKVPSSLRHEGTQSVGCARVNYLIVARSLSPDLHERVKASIRGTRADPGSKRCAPEPRWAYSCAQTDARGTRLEKRKSAAAQSWHARWHTWALARAKRPRVRSGTRRARACKSVLELASGERSPFYSETSRRRIRDDTSSCGMVGGWRGLDAHRCRLFPARFHAGRPDRQRRLWGCWRLEREGWIVGRGRSARARADRAWRGGLSSFAEWVCRRPHRS